MKKEQKEELTLERCAVRFEAQVKLWRFQDVMDEYEKEFDELKKKRDERIRMEFGEAMVLPGYESIPAAWDPRK